MADFILYTFGKKYGRRIVTHKRFHKIISPERLSILEEKFNKRGILFILIGRHLVGLRAQIFLAAGVMKMPTVKFLIADAVSSLLTIAVMVGIGYVGGNSLQVIRKDITKIEHIAILLIIILIVTWLLFRHHRARTSSDE